MTDHIIKAYHRLPVEIIRGDGYYLYDKNGKEYLDFATGIAVISLGHNNKNIINALIEQANLLWHCSNLFTIPGQVKLAKRLTDLTFAEQVFFCSTGLEAVETAIKLIRKYHYEKANDKNKYPYKIITFENGFHGRSIACLSAGGNEHARRGFGPFLPGFIQIPLSKEIFDMQISSGEIAGVIIEPVQSEGGVHIVPPEFLQYIRKVTAEKDIILCLDEVQTGFGRCGSMFKYQQLGFEPDILTIAKAMGNGFPVAACLVKDSIANYITPGSHGSTFGGNPLAMAVANAVLDEFIKNDICSNVNNLSIYFKNKLNNLKLQYPHLIVDIRIDGLLIGIEITVSAKYFIQIAIENGLIVTRAGNDNVIRILPPLNIDNYIIDKSIEILEFCFESIKNIDQN